MGSSLLVNPLIFLIDTLLTLYIVAVLLRFLLQWARADFYNPLSQFLVKITNPLLRPLRRVIPGYRGIDVASIVLMLVLQYVGLLLMLGLLGAALSPGTLLVWTVAKLLALLINVWLVLIIVAVILSWVSPRTYNPATALVYGLTEPVLAPARRLIRPISGIDLSPLLVLIVLQLAKIVLVELATSIAAPPVGLF